MTMDDDSPEGWYYLGTNGSENGPLNFRIIRAHLRLGTLPHDIPVRRHKQLRLCSFACMSFLLPKHRTTFPFANTLVVAVSFHFHTFTLNTDNFHTLFGVQVWREGLQDWTEAKNISLFRNMGHNVPPVSQSNKTNQQGHPSLVPPLVPLL